MNASFTLVAFGDSLTYGYGAPESCAYPFRLAKDFPHWNVYNRGINGDTTREAIARIDTDVLSKRGQIVAVWFGANDSAFSEGYYRTIVEYRNNLRIIAQKILSTTHGQAFNDRKSLPLFVTPPPTIDENDFAYTTTARLKMYSECVKQVADDFGIPVVDFFTVLLNQQDHDDYESYFQSDGTHLSPKGYDLFYAAFRATIDLYI